MQFTKLPNHIDRLSDNIIKSEQAEMQQKIFRKKGITMTKKLSKLLAILLIVALAASLPAASAFAAGDSRVYTINSTQSVPLFEQWLVKFTEYTTELSDGSIQFNMFPTGSMGNSTEALTACQMGTLDFVLGGDVELGPIVKNSDWCSLPGYITTHEQGLDEYINGFIGDYADTQYAEAGLITLTRIDNSFRNLAIKGVDVKTADDVKGLRIRIPNQPLPMQLYEQMGALPVALAASEVLIALEQNTIDGADNAIFLFDQFKQYDLFDSIVALNYGYGVINLFCSAVTWETIPEADRELMMQGAQMASDWYHSEFLAAEEEVIERAKADGKYVVPDEEWLAELWTYYDVIWENALASGKYDEAFINELYELYLTNTGR